MIITHVTTVHPPEDPRIFFKECRTLLDAGYQVHAVCPAPPSLPVEGLKYHVTRGYRSRLLRWMLGVPAAFIASLKTHARIVHIHDPELLPLSFLWRVLGREVIYDIHEDYVTSIRLKQYLPAPLRKALAAVAGGLERLMACCCRKIIAEKYYAERFPGAVTVLNYPLLDRDAGASGPAPPPAVLDENYAWCLYTGNITEVRGALNHLNVLSGAPETGLCMVGRCSGALCQELFDRIAAQGIARERLVIVGRERYVAKDEMDAMVGSRSWLAGLAVFPPTDHYVRKEPTKLFEYMRDAIPILASDFPAWRALVEECRSGILVHPDDPAALAAAAERLIRNPRDREEMGANGRRAVGERYNWGNEGRKLLELYREIERRP